MPLVRARILKAQAIRVDALTPLPKTLRDGHASILRRELMDAKVRAEAVAVEAKSAAAKLLHAARAEAEQIKQRAHVEGHEAGLLEAAAKAVAFVEAEQRAQVRAVDTTVALARLLAERLLGRSLTTEASTVTDLAKTLLAEVRGARMVTFRAHPNDVAALTSALEGLVPHTKVVVEAKAELASGDFQLTTDIGSLEGALRGRLDVLAAKVKQGLTE